MSLERKNNYIFINLSMCEKLLSWTLPKLVYAMGIEEAWGYQPVILDWERDLESEPVYQKFGADFVSIRKLRNENISGFFSALVSVCRLFVFHNSGTNLVNYEYHGAYIGGMIYDKLVRFGKEKIYTIDRLKFRRDFGKVLGMVWLADTMERFFGRHSGSLLVMDDFAFDEGIMTMEAVLQDVEVRESSSLYEGELGITKEEIRTNKCSRMRNQVKAIYDAEKPSGDPFYEEYAKEYFSKRLEIVTDKQSLRPSREEFVEKLHTDPEKKNVFILASCFADIAHGKADYLFSDYYVFTEKTLEATKKLSNANWIIKAHPYYHKLYNEENLTIELYEKYKNPNLYYMPEEWDKADLGEIADVIITAIGSGGNEYACMGIPVILTAYGPYSGYGFTKEPETTEEYFELLGHIDSLERLGEKQKTEAKKLLFCSKRSTYQNIEDDEFSGLYMENRELFFSGEKSLSETNESFRKKLEQSFPDKEAFRKTIWYQRGKNYQRKA